VAQAQQNEVADVIRSTVTPSSTEKPQYLPVTQSQQMQGVEFTASNFHTQDNHVFVDVCYDLPGNDVWDVNMATLQYGDKSTSDFAVNEFFVDVAKDNKQKGSRCLSLDFYGVDPGGNFSTLKLMVGNIGQIPPTEGHECEGYLGRINNNTKVLELGIEVACEQLPYGSQINVMKKPNSMSDEDANTWVAQAMYGQVNGPWEFTVTLNK
jgi:hypothetical protein